jgi:hypothetical protein
LVFQRLEDWVITDHPHKNEGRMGDHQLPPQKGRMNRRSPIAPTKMTKEKAITNCPYKNDEGKGGHRSPPQDCPHKTSRKIPITPPIDNNPLPEYNL